MDKAPRQTLTAPIRRIRFAYVALFFCVWTVIIAAAAGMAAGSAARRLGEAGGVAAAEDVRGSSAARNAV